MSVDQKQIKQFQKNIWDFYGKNKRDLPWRNTKSQYEIFISEVMLQQTQVSRVTVKYHEWIRALPDFQSLSNTKLQKILILWSGLGYNRRAKFLLESSKIITSQFNGIVPDSPDQLVKLPGIGKATAASIIVFSYNKPLPFIETNIRRVFIHEFFKGGDSISDKDILRLVTLTLDTNNPREWYYALMDYGSYLGKTVINPNRKSKTYAQQSKFQGSIRQTRGELLKILTQNSYLRSELAVEVKSPHFEKALEQLTNELFIEQKDGRVSIR